MLIGGGGGGGGQHNPLTLELERPRRHGVS